MKIQPLSSFIGSWKGLIVGCSAGEVLNSTVTEQRGGSLAHYPSPYSSLSSALEVRQSDFPFDSLFRVSRACSCKIWINFSSLIFSQTQVALGCPWLPCFPFPSVSLHQSISPAFAFWSTERPPYQAFAYGGVGQRKGKHLWWVSYQRDHTNWSGRDTM